MHPIRSSLDRSQTWLGDPFVGPHDSDQPAPGRRPSAVGINPATTAPASIDLRPATVEAPVQPGFLPDSPARLVRPAVEVIGLSESQSDPTDDLKPSSPAALEATVESLHVADEWAPSLDRPTFDARDFLNPDAIPRPIGALLPHLQSGLDEFTSQQLALADAELTSDPQVAATDPGELVAPQEPGVSRSIGPPVGLPTRVAPEEVIFARSGQVIRLDGDQGIDLIDLQCFTIGQASFEPSRIVIEDALRQATYRIEYRNIQRAIFANQVEVPLD